MMLIRSRRERQMTQARIEAMSRLEESILNSTRLDEVLARGVKIAVEALGAAWGAAWVCDRDMNNLRVAATFGTASAAHQSEADDRLASLAEHAKRAMRGRGLLHRTGGTGGGPAEFPAVAVPVIAFGEVLGAIALAGRLGSQPKGFSSEDEPFLRLFAAHAALAIQNASILTRQHEAEKRLKDVERQLIQTAKLAALGEMSAKLAHEIRNPLSAIGGFARRIMKALPKEDPNRSYAEIIARETARLEVILSEHLDFARVRPPRLANIDLNATVHEVIELIRPECDSGGVKLLEAYESRIPPMLLDAGRVKQVLLNILKNARQSTRQGQRIRVRTRSADGWAQIEIANDGEKLPGEILEQLFVPFATAKNGGNGLGLAVADQIVKEHGGEIRVRSDPEWSVVFTVSFPLRTNQDRRRGSERRAGNRRRAA
jgi:signal transduction histidine kinase